jgi:hypothetical protein
MWFPIDMRYFEPVAMVVRGFIVSLALLAACGAPEPPDVQDTRDAGPAVDAFTLPDVTPEQSFKIQFVDPDHGSFNGATEVSLRGNGFTEDMTITVGGRLVEPIDTEHIDDRRVTFLTPPGTPGLADVEIQKGTFVATLADGYTYEAIDIEPDFGAVAGGTFVTVSGFGTDFDDATVVTFDGVPMTVVDVVSETQLTGRTPPGVSGDANVLAITRSGTFDARRAYTYNTTVDPFRGGMGGGPIEGTVNVTVIDSRTDNGVDNALVAIGDPLDTPYIGRADDLGQITFSAPGLAGPITVTAAADEYETQQFVSYDARDITIFLVRAVPPTPGEGPFPPGRQPARIFGHVVFGGPTGIGIENWNLVPEPRTPTEVKRVYVTTTAAHPFTNPYAPTRPIDYVPGEGKSAWEFDVYARASALAVVAVAGLYDPAQDPSGLGVTGFEPFAMGVTRGILVGPGEDKVGVDVLIDIPLDTTLQVDLIDPPLLNSRDYPGPILYQIRPFLDFGGEGVIAMNKNGLVTPPLPEQRPNYYDFADGETSIILPRMAPLSGAIVDASYTFVAGAYSDFGTNPYSVRVARGNKEVEYPIEIGDFIGTPRPVDPVEGGTASSFGVEIEAEGPAAGFTTFHVHLISQPFGPALFRIFARGNILDLDLPDLAPLGMADVPRGKDLNWTFYSLRIIGGAAFDDFHYGMLSLLYWDAYAVDAAAIQLPND